NKSEQPAVWVSGFFGSGKSHLVRVLEYLWRDFEFPDGAVTRSITNIPKSIKDYLVELTNQGKLSGGLWSAAGTLGAGMGKSIRLALLSIIFRSAGLPEQYAPAQFVVWLKQNGYFNGVKKSVESAGKDFSRELNNLWVSPILANALLKEAPDFANDQIQARDFFKTRYPNRTEISDEEMLLTIKDVLSLVSNKNGKFPCTLLVFDELQQFIGEDSERALQVQNIVEACSSRFGSRILFVATGQSALGKTTQLSKLKGRFTVQVELSDNDVEHVVREVVLQKKEDKKAELTAVLEKASGEISRHLSDTRIGSRATDKDDLVPDYPLLPVRRRFWESVLRAVDSAGTAGQLRTQLRIVHEAARDVAENSVGHVVAGDFIYDQLKPDMLQSGVLLRPIDYAINEQMKKTPDGKLRARICALIFLIGKLPNDGIAAIGVHPTASTLADLLVEDLTVGSAALRQQVIEVLKELASEDILMAVGDEYRLQTRESAEWEQDFKSRFIQIKADEARIASDRLQEVIPVVQDTLKGITFTQGSNKTPRRFELSYGLEAPMTNTGAVPVWIRDEWSVSEKTVREDAQREGIESPIVFVLIPRINPDGLKNALATFAAAKETIDVRRPRTSTPEGQEACSALEAKQRAAQSNFRTFITQMVHNARIYQGGGIEVNENGFKNSIQTAINASLYHLYPDFDDVDVVGWGTVVKRAGDGAADALNAVNFQGDADKHKACKKVRDFIGGGGKKGHDVRKKFMGPPFGWPQDAVDGCLLALMAGGFVRASKNGSIVPVKGFNQSQIGVTNFYSEGITISALQRIAIRKFIQSVGLSIKPNEEAEAIPLVIKKLEEQADGAGGDAPLPEHPSTRELDDLKAMSGNEQFIAVHDRIEILLNKFNEWKKLEALCKERWPRWELLNNLTKYAGTLPVYSEVVAQITAIRQGRSLLTNPDPVDPLLKQLSNSLRLALQERHTKLTGLQKVELDALKALPEWEKLNSEEQQAILTSNELDHINELKVGTDADLLNSLEAGSITNWDNRIAALPERALRAREAIIRYVTPKAKQVIPPRVTISTEEELDEYLQNLRKLILEHLNNGNPVIL
ncbi:BREX system P-loop protein BrxC, partial [Chloroflexota bacterium]